MGSARVVKALPVLVLALALLLTAAAIRFLPASLYFPVVEYSASANDRITLLRNGELDDSSCRQAARQLAQAVRANCPACKVAEHCFHGLDVERRKLMSNEPLSTPSARVPGGSLTMVFSMKNPRQALAVCRQIERQSASQPGKRLRCFPALAPR